MLETRVIMGWLVKWKVTLKGKAKKVNYVEKSPGGSELASLPPGGSCVFIRLSKLAILK